MLIQVCYEPGGCSKATTPEVPVMHLCLQPPSQPRSLRCLEPCKTAYKICGLLSHHDTCTKIHAEALTSQQTDMAMYAAQGLPKLLLE